MATPNFSVATPQTQGAAMPLLLAGQLQDAQRARTDAGVNQGYLTSTYTNRSLPQLQSGIAAGGNWYSGARQKAEKNSYEDFLKGSYDIESGLQRQLDNMTRERMMASVGLII
jgi:hypothetical protein